MAVTCNGFTNNTLGATQNLSACKASHAANLSDHELLPEQFMLLVLDGLQRFSNGEGTAFPDLADGSACDFATVLRNASCALLTNTPQFPTTPAELQAQILWMINEALCGE